MKNLFLIIGLILVFLILAILGVAYLTNVVFKDLPKELSFVLHIACFAMGCLLGNISYKTYYIFKD